jgi:primosomal protein N' (replication factor Y)
VPLEVMVAPTSSDRTGGIARCVVLLRLHHLGDRLFDYAIPDGLTAPVEMGSVVTVPFGKRTARAVVVGLGPSPGAARSDLREICAVSADRISPELIDLARAVSSRYLCSLESCLRLMVAPGRPQERAGSGSRRRGWVTLAGAAQMGIRITTTQKAVLELVPPEGIDAASLLERAGAGRGVLLALERKGLVAIGPPAEKQPDPVGPVGEGGADPGPARVGEGPELWPEQQEAVTELVAALQEPVPSRRVLWGITGSGKTEVYLRVIGHALARGGGTIFLVPEIALTPQTIDRVRARFGTRVAVLHSGLPRGERLREYRRMAAGDATIVVGARSAVFAPVKDLRLVIIDEAHDPSYKQEEEPRYEVRTVAALRLEKTGGLLVEGSATPSVESIGGRAPLVRLRHRAAGSPPEIEVVDMRRQGPGELLAARSRQALAEVLRAGEQAIVLLNRRGYAGFIHCESCGHVMMCVECEMSLTYHSRERRLVCHHCARAYPQPPVCPACGQAPLTRTAPGTERLDRELRRLVPRDQVFRMDSDVVGGGRRAQEVLAAFAQARPAVLVGTQMVAKGHDFPDVTLVVVADADIGLYVPDFRAAERTFQLLTQVAGRAGRAERPGRVLVQTWNPEVPCIRMALEKDEEGFYRQELAARERLGYPPFAELIRLLTLSADSGKSQAGANLLVERLRPHFRSGEIRGPVRLPTLRGRERWQVVIAAADGERARAIVGQAGAQLQEPYRRRGVTLLIDVDPQSFN